MKIVKFKFIEKHRYADSKKLPLHKGAFLFTYVLSIFLTSTAFVSTNAKIRHASFEICRVFENCPLGDAPIA